MPGLKGHFPFDAQWNATRYVDDAINSGAVLLTNSDLTLPKLVYQLFSVQALRPHRVGQHSRTMGIMVKVRDEIGGSIRRGKVHKIFGRVDKLKMQEGESMAREIL